MKGLFVTICVSAITLLQAQETQRQYLSGTGSDNTVNWQFYCTGGRNAGKWGSIAVPSCWELQGYGKYDYGFSKDSARGKEKGMYKYAFTVPAGWKHKKINLVFEGVMTDAEVKVNGRLAGKVHEGAFYAFSYDITTLLQYNRSNQLEVTVAKHSANASVNAAERKADFWLFGGIFRPVYLEALPQQHIAGVAIDAKADGSFVAKVQTAGAADKVTVQLYTLAGKAYGDVVTVPVNGKDATVAMNSHFQQPLLWNCETPHLYNAVFTLYQGDKVVHTIQQRFGFRTVEVKLRDGIYVNGVKVKMKGVNRHSFWPTTGRTTSKQLSIDDVLMMKDMNMNAVRMSHYPPDGHFLDMCDSLGLFVMDELAGWHGHYDTPTGRSLLKEMIAHDRNHPSIIFWANGNEGGHNFDLDAVFTQLDMQQRPVIHPWESFSGFETQHYRDYSYGIGHYDHGHQIVMPTEFLHGMYDGGHGAGLDDYWEAMWHNPLSAGGFLWDFADEGVVRTDKNGVIDTDDNHGPDGLVGPYHEKEGSYFTVKEIWCPVHIEPKDITAAFDGKLTIENRYFYTNMNQCRFTWKLKQTNGGKELTGTAVAPDISPSAHGQLQLALPAGWTAYDVLYVTAFDATNHELFTWSFPVALPNVIAQRKITTSGAGAVQLTETDSAFQVAANGVQALFHKRTGLLQQVSNAAGKILLSNGPIVQQGVTNFAGFTATQKGDTVVIRSVFDRANSYNTLEWTIYPSGWIKMNIHYFPGAYFTDFIGVNFSFPEKEMVSVDYLGKGPYRVWKNRLKGGMLDVWHKDYNSAETGEAPFQYPEFKGYHANMYWCRFHTKGRAFTVVTETEDVFLRLFTPVVKDDPKDTWKNLQYVFPDGDISFMQGISGVGTKTQKRETTGPMGMKNIMYDYEKEPARALNMVLYFDFTEKP
ncbi:Beta-galactosidase/beta-glucuronidase [Filimonas lacunae]|uniref:beta-galactosidase n=1 Tax=Filimonas lacunae TaxID=477680 RepID=A0A173MC66_9BACT|nr:glycoside hydrolase family 2 [Filimonas lacunae]BAV05173.1 beta-galactosidase [Filimonas lacunae]SIT22803.1 Beta-galactosidase/beta-glucuronidase [Filimonas lacunae]